MLNQNQIDEFRTKGFLLGGCVVSGKQVDVLRAEIDRVLVKQNTDKPQPVRLVNLSPNPDSVTWQITNMWEASDPFCELIYNPKIVGEVVQLTGAHQLRVWHDQIQYKLAERGGITGWHQDSPCWPILTPKTSQVTAWVALDDVDTSNGCMSMVAGAYHWGDQIDFLHSIQDFNAMPSTFQDRDVQVELCPVRAGHVHFHHGLAWHGSHANTSDRPRRAIAIHYMTDETRYDSSGNHTMKPFVGVMDGEVLAGDRFPLVWDDGRVMHLNNKTRNFIRSSEN